MPNRYLFALLIACLPWFSVAQNDHLRVEVYALQHQTPDGVLPAVNSVLQRGESAKGFNNDLVVNASDNTHHEVSYLLGQLDRPSRNLLIHVQDNTAGSSFSNDSGLSGGIRTGTVVLGTGKPIVHDSGLVIRHDGLQAHTNQMHQQSTRNQSQQVRAIEGYPAWISTGQSAPVRSYDYYGNPTAEYVDANQGFYVTARLVGDRVQLDISATNDRFVDTRRAVIDTQQVHTTVSGAIGQWIDLGSIETSARDSGGDYTSRNSSTGSRVTGIAVRVVPID